VRQMRHNRFRCRDADGWNGLHLPGLRTRHVLGVRRSGPLAGNPASLLLQLWIYRDPHRGRLGGPSGLERSGMERIGLGRRPEYDRRDV
jgi:hypothetical protein